MRLGWEENANYRNSYIFSYILWVTVWSSQYGYERIWEDMRQQLWLHEKSLDLVSLCSCELLHKQEKIAGFSILIDNMGLMPCSCCASFLCPLCSLPLFQLGHTYLCPKCLLTVVRERPPRAQGEQRASPDWSKRCHNPASEAEKGLCPVGSAGGDADRGSVCKTSHQCWPQPPGSLTDSNEVCLGFGWIEKLCDTSPWSWCDPQPVGASRVSWSVAVLGLSSFGQCYICTHKNEFSHLGNYFVKYRKL